MRWTVVFTGKHALTSFTGKEYAGKFVCNCELTLKKFEWRVCRLFRKGDSLFCFAPGKEEILSCGNTDFQSLR